MQEIKFRAYIESLNKICDVKGITFLDTNTISVSVEVDGMRETYRLSDPSRLMQYTGKKDKNGKEIYQDYILEADEDEEYYARVYGSSYRCVVTWDDYKARFKLGAGEGFATWSWSKSWRIIGNRHSNPELLDSLKK